MEAKSFRFYHRINWWQILAIMINQWLLLCSSSYSMNCYIPHINLNLHSLAIKMVLRDDNAQVCVFMNISLSSISWNEKEFLGGSIKCARSRDQVSIHRKFSRICATFFLVFPIIIRFTFWKRREGSSSNSNFIYIRTLLVLITVQKPHMLLHVGNTE